MVRNDEIAKAAGVSTVTVSRVLNNAPNVAPATREAVLKAARELGKPVAAESPRRKVLVLSLFSGLELNEPLTRAAESCNVSLLFKNLYQQDLTLETVLRDSAVDGDFDGALLVDCDIGPQEAAPLLEKMPVVQCRNYNGLEREVAVLMDDTAAGQLVTSHLMETGRKRIAFAHLNQYAKNRPHGVERFNGCMAALAQAGRTLAAEYTLGEWGGENPSLAAVWEQLRRDAGDRWDALILPESLKELPALRYGLEQEGKDVALAALGDGPAAQLAEVTAVVQPLEGIARNALFLLTSLMEGRLQAEESIQLRLRPQLSIRSSTEKKA